MIEGIIKKCLLKKQGDFIVALSAMAPSERNEHLIYAIFPVSLTFYLVLSLDFALDPRIWVAFVTIVAPLLILLLYELGIDEFIVKAISRWYLLRKDLRLELKKNLSKHRRIVENQEEPFTDKKVRTAVGNALSSYPIKRKLWRLRATFFLLLSLFFLAQLPFISFRIPVMNVEGVYELERTSLISSEFIHNLSTPLLMLYGALFVLLLAITLMIHWWKVYSHLLRPAVLTTVAFGIALVIEKLVRHGIISDHWPINIMVVLGLLISAANFYRHRSIFKHIQNVTMFLNLFDLLASDYVRSPEQYVSKESDNDPKQISHGWKLPAKNHLEYLDRVLIRGDWAVFLQSWNKIQIPVAEHESITV